jgi:replicative DNA helicase
VVGRTLPGISELGRGVEDALVGMTPPERPPPHDLEAEQATLGAAMLSADALATVLTQLDADDFYRPAHRTVYATLADLHARGDRADVVTVGASLDRRRALADVGGAPFLHTLVASVPTVAGVGQYAARVAELAVRRRLIDAGVRIASLGLDDPDGARAVEAAKGVLEEVAGRALSADAADHGVLLDIDDFLAQPEPDYDWIIPGLLERGDRTILTGLEGAGKSVLFRQIATQAAAGLHPFTGETIDPVRVLLVDCENSGPQVRREIRPLRLRAGVRLERAMLFIVVQPQGIDLYGEVADARWLEAKIKAAAPDLVALGPLYKLAGGDPTSEEVARKVSAVLDHLRVRYGFALLLEGHSPHGQGGHRAPRGPTAPRCGCGGRSSACTSPTAGPCRTGGDSATSGNGRPRSSEAGTGPGRPTAIPGRCCGAGSSPASRRTVAPIPSPGWRGCWALARGRSSVPSRPTAPSGRSRRRPSVRPNDHATVACLGGTSGR